MDQKKPTIIFLASWYPTPYNKHHGIFIRNHALALSQFMNVIVVYAYSSSKITSHEISKNTVNSNFEEWRLEYQKVKSTFPLVSAVAKLLRFKKAYKQLLAELITQKTTVTAIQLNTIFPAALVLGAFKNHFKVPHAIVEHWSGYLPEDANYKGFITKYVTKKAVSQAAKIFYVSEKQKQAMQQHGLIGNYELLYNVIDTSIFFPHKTSPVSRPLLLHVSSLVEREKNISGTLAVIKQLQEKKLEFDFVFLGGEKTLVNHFQNMATQAGIKNTVFLGEKTPQEVATYMQKAHALILFSNYEGMPVVALEALACGLPVFASNVGQLPFLINITFGKLVEPKNELQLTQELELFLQGKYLFDAIKMQQFIAEHASMQQVGKKLFDFYTKNI